MNVTRRTFARLEEALPGIIYLVAIGVLFVVFALAFERPASAAFCDGVSPAAVCPPSGMGFICICSGSGDDCAMGCLDIPPLTCEGQGMTGGPWPYCTPIDTCPSAGNSCSSAANSCGMTGSGTIDAGSCSCNASTPSDALCPAPTCGNGSPGPYPSCPLPTCADLGLEGIYPACYAPPPLTCEALGLIGTYPFCYAEPPPTCLNGSPGPYPSCPLAPEDDPPSCVINTGAACNTNSCGVSGGTVQCDGSCSGSTPAPIDQCPADAGLQCSASACGGGGGGGGGGACPGTDAATISATPNRVIAGANTSVTLTWSGSDLDATTCTVTNLTTGAPVKAATAVASCSMSDSSAVASVNAQTTFRLACGSLTRDVTVNVLPKFEEF